MGIRGLESFVKKYSVGAHREPVDVRAIAKKYIEVAAKAAPAGASAPAAPLVLVDGESLVFYLLESSKLDQFSGGKNAELGAAAVEFVRVFVDAGFRLHVVFQVLCEFPCPREKVHARVDVFRFIYTICVQHTIALYPWQGLPEPSKEASIGDRRLEQVAACRERVELLANDRVNELRRSSKPAYMPSGSHTAVKAALRCALAFVPPFPKQCCFPLRISIGESRSIH